MSKTIVDRIAEGFVGFCLMGIGVMVLFASFLGDDAVRVILLFIAFALIVFGAILATQKGPFRIDIGGPLGFKFSVAGGGEADADHGEPRP
jgi:hypothetical protein